MTERFQTILVLYAVFMFGAFVERWLWPPSRQSLEVIVVLLTVAMEIHLIVRFIAMHLGVER